MHRVAFDRSYARRSQLVFMKLANTRIFVVVCLLFIASKGNAQKDETEDYELYANQIVCSLAKEMKNEFDLLCIGEGGSMPHDVREMSVKFIAYKRASIEQARELMVKVTERFIDTINAHSKIRPFLREYPVQPFRAEVSISFKKKNNHSYTDGSVAYVLQVRDKICYNKRDPSNPVGLVTLLEELYKEALRIVQSNESE